MKRRIAKKLHHQEVARRREAIGDARPCPPERTGELLVPEGYVGWVLITTPGPLLRRRKVRYLGSDGRVYRDDLCLRGGRFHVRVHAVSCRVEPVALVTAGVSPADEDLADALPPRPHFHVTGPNAQAVVEQLGGSRP